MWWKIQGTSLLTSDTPAQDSDNLFAIAIGGDCHVGKLILVFPTELTGLSNAANQLCLESPQRRRPAIQSEKGYINTTALREIGTAVLDNHDVT